MNPADSPHEKLLVVSPHLDDAILSCGLWLAAQPGARVCTAFTAAPEENMSTEWDARCGFGDAHEAMRARKIEDTQALAQVGATPVHLPFCDAQYRSSPSRQALVDALERALDDARADRLLLPLGLYHSDHTLVANACLALLPRLGADTPVCFYEDVPYRGIPGVVQTRLARLLEHGYRLVAYEPPHENDARNQPLKDAALRAYPSQLRAFGPEGYAGLCAPERYWSLHETLNPHVPDDTLPVL